MNNALILIKSGKKVFLILLVFIAITGGLLAFLTNPNNDAVYTVTRENLINTVSANGTYTTGAQTPVISSAKGIITKIYVKNGDSIKKGDFLFYIDSTASEDEQKAAYVNYQNALNALSTAENNKQSLDAAMWAKRESYIVAQNSQKYKNEHSTNPATGNDYTDLEKLAIDNAVVQAQKDFTATEKAFKSSDDGVNAASSQVSQALLAYNETQNVNVTAPANGKVANFLKNIGDQVLPDPTSPVLFITDFGNPAVTAEVNEVNIPRLAVGQKAKIVFDALPDESFSGTVGGIDDVGVKVQGAIIYNVRISLDKLTKSVKPQMTASITIETGRKEGILTIPNTALIKKNQKTYVQKAGSKASDLTEVILGMKGLIKTEIISGLSEGDKILIQD